MSEEIDLVDDADDGDFDSGFDGNDSLPTETPEASEAFSADIEEQPEAAPKTRQLTEDEYQALMSSVTGMNDVRATLENRFGTAFGKIGGIERVIKQLQEATPQGEAVEITDDDFAELREEYPDLADLQLKGLQRIASKLRGTGSAQMDEGRIREFIAPTISQASDYAVERAKAEIAEETLAETHPQWRDVIGNPEQPTEYRKWLATQPHEYQERVNNSYSPVVIGRSLDKFNEHQASLKKKADSSRRDRFEQAVTPRGDGGHPSHSSGDDDFDAGFRTG